MLRTTAAATNTKSFLQPRRTSFAVRLPPTSTAQVLQPKRRVSIATFRPESNSHMTTPLNTQLKSRGAVGRQSFVRDPHRIRRISRIFSPLRRASGATVQATPTAMRSSSRFMGSSLQATPTSMRSSSKFMGSPSMEAGSLRSKYPAIIASAKETVSVEPTEDEGRHEKLQKVISTFLITHWGMNEVSACIINYTKMTNPFSPYPFFNFLFFWILLPLYAY